MEHPEPQPRQHRRVALVDGDRGGREAMARVLGPIVSDLEAHATLGELPTDDQPDLVVVDYDALSATDRAQLPVRFATRTRPPGLLLVSAGQCQSQRHLQPLLSSRVLTNLLGRNGELDAEDLLVTVRKLLGRDVFGLEQYFPRGAQSSSTRLRRSSELEPLLARTEAYAGGLAIPRRLVGQLCGVVDELVTNAFYNAPRDQDGHSRFAHLPRCQEVELAGGEEVEVQLCCDGRRLGIAVADPFGALTPDVLLDYLAKGFLGGEGLVEDKPGGAGLGLFYVFDSVSHLVANISPGTRTEVIGLIDIRGRYRDFAVGNKSFNIFLGD